MFNRKYKLIKVGQDAPGVEGWRHPGKHSIYRITALRDIPEHGVKKGDLGGLVNNRRILSHEGSCWIGGEAKVFGRVIITENAYVGDTAQVGSGIDFTYTKFLISLKGNTKVIGNARLFSGSWITEDAPGHCIVDGDVTIMDNAKVINPYGLAGTIRIRENAQLSYTRNFKGKNVDIYGEAKLLRNSGAIGISSIYGNAVLRMGAVAENSIVCGEAAIAEGETIKGANLTEAGVFANPKVFLDPATKMQIGTPAQPLELPVAQAHSIESAPNNMLKVFNEVKADIEAYESDIVKIIKYPVMTDRTDNFTMKMIMALKNARRFMDAPDSNEFKTAVIDLEEKFLAAESNALKISSSALSESDLKKLERAKDLLKIASNEGSAENEKKISFKQAFKQLEGVVAVPEIAVDTFRIKIGLPQLEM